HYRLNRNRQGRGLEEREPEQRQLRRAGTHDTFQPAAGCRIGRGCDAVLLQFVLHCSYEPIPAGKSTRPVAPKRLNHGTIGVMTALAPLPRERPSHGRQQGAQRMAHVDEDSGSRRDFLYVATAAAGTVATAAAVWPLVNQMNPSADVQALASIQVDVSALEPGSQMTVKFLGKPVFIRRRTEDEIAAARSVDLSDLPDQLARNANIL